MERLLEEWNIYYAALCCSKFQQLTETNITKTKTEELKITHCISVLATQLCRRRKQQHRKQQANKLLQFLVSSCQTVQIMELRLPLNDQIITIRR